MAAAKMSTVKVSATVSTVDCSQPAGMVTSALRCRGSVQSRPTIGCCAWPRPPAGLIVPLKESKGWS